MSTSSVELISELMKLRKYSLLSSEFQDSLMRIESMYIERNNFNDIINTHNIRSKDVILHRVDGAAIGTVLYNQWFIHGKEVNSEEYKKWLIDQGIDIHNITPEDEIMINLKWG